MSSPSRNQPCPCGSGRKFKHCCGDAAVNRKSLLLPVVQIGLPDGRLVSISAAIQAALQLQQAGRLREASAIYDLVLRRDPANADALHLKGLTARLLGDSDTAVALIQRAIEVNPAVPIFHNNLAEVFLSTNRFNKAIERCRSAIHLQPDLPEAHFNLGRALRGQGRFEEAASCFERAISWRPNFADAHASLGGSLLRQGKVQEAVVRLKRAVELNPQSTEAHINLGIALAAQGAYEAAIAHYERALAIDPHSVDACNSLGNVYAKQERWEQAIRYYERALEIDPTTAIVHNNLASALTYQRRFDEALVQYECALELEPTQAQFCSNLLQTLNYVPGRDPESLYAAHCRYGQQFGEQVAASVLPHTNDPSNGRRLKIGYVSSNFRQHAIAHFIEPVLEQHDHGLFEIFCYSNYGTGDAVTQRLRSHADQWRAIMGMTDERVAQQIRQDGIDILVDLDGHCGTNRLPVFTRKPAPIQVSWIGYPNTTGLSTMDYRITDRFADPVGTTERFHSEQLVRLPDCFSCYRPPQDCPDVTALPALHRGIITFGSFNALVKINTDVITLWAKLLQAVPGAKLVLKSKGLEEMSSQEAIAGAFESHGIGKERLNLLGHSVSQAEHLQHYNLIDIALDPFPYNGTTTTCDALWMGIPVITLAGKTHASRVGVSQMTILGLPEFVAANAEEYIEIAVRMADDLTALAEIRLDLRERMSSSPLVNARLLTRNLERAYREMWQKWCAKIPEK